MNATPMQLSPVSAAPIQPAPGKQPSSDSPEGTFSKVLSSEVAQKRNGGETRDDPQSSPDTAYAQQASDPASSGTGLPDKPEASDTVQFDPQAPQQTLIALGLHPGQYKLASNDADATSGDLADTAALSPDALSGRKGSKGPMPFISQETKQPVAGEQPDAALLNLDSQAAQKGRKGQIPLATAAGRAHVPVDSGEQAAPASPPETPVLKATKSTTSVANAQATLAPTTAAIATAFSAQMASARQTDALKVGDTLSEPLLDPAMRSSPQTLIDAATSMAGAASSRLAPSVGTTAWSQALGEKVVWMAAGAQKTASLTLNPPNMGPLQIVLNLSNDQATASFFSAQPEVRQALEAAFPRLREMMNEAGIQLGQATVSADTPRQHDTSNGKAQQAAFPFPGLADAVRTGETEIHIPLQRAGRGLVDTFA
ncbi:MAG: flagellar hook-length control protein FliK [Thiobacillus sp.]